MIDNLMNSSVTKGEGTIFQIDYMCNKHFQQYFANQVSFCDGIKMIQPVISNDNNNNIDSFKTKINNKFIHALCHRSDQI